MNASSLQHKTVRPGSLNSYSYYYSGRRPVAAPIKTQRPRLHLSRGLVLVLVLAALIGLPLLNGGNGGSKPDMSAASQAAPAAVAAAEPVNQCQGNSLSHLVKVSISQRHLWACQQSKQVYTSAVITGLQGHAETETPLGNYKIYAKQTNTTLTGADSRGSWSDPVSYWMPFLDNQYGTYGFHDATWRPQSAFGEIGPTSPDASHGCVELPLVTSHWLYSWAPVGTTVRIQS